MACGSVRTLSGGQGMENFVQQEMLLIWGQHLANSGHQHLDKIFNKALLLHNCIS